MSDDLPDANDALMGTGGIPTISWKDAKVKDYVKGTIMYPPETRQRTDLQTKKPLFWESGGKMLQVRIVLMTDMKDETNPDDSGERQLFVNLPSNMSRAIADACKKAGVKGLAVGGTLGVIYTGEGQKTDSWKNPPKLFAAKYEPPQVSMETPEAGNGSSQSQSVTDEQQKMADEIPF